jgi:hypothetical protein
MCVGREYFCVCNGLIFSLDPAVEFTQGEKKPVFTATAHACGSSSPLRGEKTFS